jgi:hypothetical protein
MLDDAGIFAEQYSYTALISNETESHLSRPLDFRFLSCTVAGLE